MQAPQGLLFIADALPCPLYIVGGYVRNMLLYGKADTDVDVCAALTVDGLRQALQGKGVEVVDVNPRVGTVLLKVGDERYEYTTFRKDSYPIGGVHTPDSVQFVATPQEDAQRRDFSVNALYLDVLSGRLTDPTGGLQDLQNKRIRSTRQADLVFGEDGLRILRMVRFCAQLGFSPEEETFESAKAHCAYLADISPERIWEELQKILLADGRYGVPFAHEKGLLLLDRLGAWDYIAPIEGPIVTEGCLSFYPQDLSLRLAGLCRCLALQTGKERVAFARSWLGRDGLRCPNAVIADVEALLKAEQNVPADRDAWRIWVAEQQDNCDRVGYLWNDTDKAAYARGTWRTMQEKRVPLTHKALPLTPAEVMQEGVPQRMLGQVYQAVLRYCWTHMLRPTRRRCVALVRKVWKEKVWRR